MKQRKFFIKNMDLIKLRKMIKLRNLIGFLVLSFSFVFICKTLGIQGFFVAATLGLSLYILIKYKKDLSLPFVGSFLKSRYFKTKFEISMLKNSYEYNKCNMPDSNRDTAHAYDIYDRNLLFASFSTASTYAEKPVFQEKKLFLRKFALCARIKKRLWLKKVYLQLLHVLILITESSKESFEILREEIQEQSGKVIKLVVNINGKKEVFNLEEITERIKNGRMDDLKILDKLLQELFKLHRKKQKKAIAVSLASISIILITTVVSGLITSFIFPQVFKSNAASNIWVQTSWTGDPVADTATHPTNKLDWAKYSQKDTDVAVGTEIGMSLKASTTAQTSSVDFMAGTLSDALISGTGDSASVTIPGINILLDWGVNNIESTLDTSGTAYDVFVAGNYAYVADGAAGLRIVDISNPASPNLVGTYDSPGTAYGVFVSGNYAYLADSNSVRIVDISTPATPNAVGNFATTNSCKGVYVSGNYVYAADGTTGVWIYDISNPASPVYKSVYNSSGTAKNVTVLNNTAYIADYTGGLKIVDVTTPTSPTLLGSYTDDTPHYIDISVSGNYAYMVDVDSELKIFDISTPATPSLTGSYLDRPSAIALDYSGIHLSGNYAYVSSNIGFNIFNISVPASPSLITTHNGNIQNSYISGNYGYLAIGGSGLQILDLSNPQGPSLTGSEDTSGNTYDIFTSGNYAYVADGTAGLQIIDVSNPANPNIVGTYDTSGTAYSVFVSGNYAYVADGAAGLRIIDVSTPATPSLTGTYDSPGTAYNVFVSGNYAYLVDASNYDYMVDASALLIVNISDPANPNLEGSYTAVSYTSGLHVSGNYVYLTNFVDNVEDVYSTLFIINISDPVHPARVNPVDYIISANDGHIYDVYVSGNYAYASDGAAGLRIIDITDPVHPTVISTYNTPGVALSCYVSGNYAYVADKEYGLQIINISNPASPVFAGYGPDTSYSQGVFLSTYLYVADNTTGLKIIAIGESVLSGNFTSSVIDTGQLDASWGNVSWNTTMPADTEIILKTKSATGSTIDNVDACATLTTITSANAVGSVALSNACIAAGDRYIKYYLALSTTNGSSVPALNDITFNFSYYPNNQTLTSSPYNSANEFNVVNKLAWTENISGEGTDIKFQIRTSPDNVSWTDWLGPAGTGDYYTATSGTEIINSSNSDGVNDQWFQYKAFLISDGRNTPTLSDISMTYAFNNRPEIQNVTTSQPSDSVAVEYQIRDTDTISGYVTPSFQYSTDNGSSWSNITTGLSANATSTKEVEEETYTTYATTWNARQQTSVYSTTAKIKAIINDGELVNNIASSTSAAFTLDSKAPTSPSISIKGGDTYASSTAVTLTISATDDVMAGLQMMVGNDALFTGASWEEYAVSKAWTLASGDGLKTVYVKFADWKGNTSASASDTITLDTTAPNVPANVTVRDISNYSSEEYWLFISWGVVSDPGDWQNYNIWRSTSGTDYGSAPYKIMEDRELNYTLETGLSTDTTYYYKITTQDTNNNISAFSAVVNDRPNGQGGTDTTPPTISNVATSSVSTIQATITWNTDELSKSTVGYSTTAGNFEEEKGVASMVTAHSVTLTGLAPATMYYFQIESQDPSGNTATSISGVNGYTFNTPPGPEIILDSVIASSIENTTATIEWTTDTLSDSYVVYSTHADLSGSTQTGNDAPTTDHAVTLSGLTQGIRYYYYVKSTDADTNLATDNNGGAYYNFITTQDGTAPEITFNEATGITDTTASTTLISWTTNEAATSTIRYGLLAGSYAWSAINDNYNYNHAISLSGLSGSTTYYFKLINTDRNGNSATADHNGADYSFVTLDGTGPDINAVTNADTSVTSAQITWTTGEAASSFVQYAATTTDFNNIYAEKGKNDSVLTHSVDLSGLTQNQTYYYRVRSVDASGNETIDDNNDNYYTFTTLNGPTITDITASAGETSATITWTTNVASDAFVIFDTHSDFSASSEQGISAKSNTSHSVTITGLSGGITYYYKVRSAAINNSVTTKDESYSFTTTADNVAPVISSIAASPILDTSAVIKWVTNERANSKVEYGILSGSYTTAATNSNFNLNHAITISGLVADTKYFYHVISIDESSNTSTSTEENFTTLETLSTETQVTQRESTARSQGEITGKESVGGGGVLIIDKTDKTSPTISEIKISDIKFDSATISWKTDESANSFIDYGQTTNYEKTIGHYDSAISHLVTLDNLKTQQNYHFKILSGDSSGNLAMSQDQSFVTLKINEQPQKEESSDGKKLFDDIEALTGSNETKEEIVFNAASAAKQALNIINGISSQVSINTLEPLLYEQFNSLQGIAQLIPPPIMSGEPKVITTATTAIITWKTDRESNSLVALASDGNYQLSTNKENAYVQTLGNPGEKTKEHAVTIYDLEPDTVYHYRIQSQGEIGPMAKSSDFTLKTKTESLEISNYAIQNISNEKAIFKWITNLETDSQIKYIPYRDNKLMVEETKITQDKAMSLIHEIEINDFESGVIYELEFLGKDLKGQLATKKFNTFSTGKDDLPPIIYQVQTESAISPGKEERIQTIISWLTNEPSTSRVYFKKGIGQEEEELTEKTQLDNNFSKKHVVIITKFDPGAVYSFKVESIDSGGNTNLSKTYTILTPRQKESVFQVIMKNLEQTFGWLSKIKQ